MNVLQTILAFLLAISILVVVHELGHYLVARIFNVKVLKFSLGMGKTLYSRRFGRDQTEWAISLFPVGGYVRLLDARTAEPETLENEDMSREFTQKNVWARIAIVAAGSLANFLLAIFILSGLFMYGVPEPAAKLRHVEVDTPAWVAGLRGGERVISINEKPVSTWPEVRWQLMGAVMNSDAIVLEVLPEGAPAGQAEKFVLPVGNRKIDEVDARFLDRFGLFLARPPAIIQAVIPGGPAEKAGLVPDDLILAVDGEKVIDGVDFIMKIRESVNKSVQLEVLRNGRELQIGIVPETVFENGETVGKIKAVVPITPEMVMVRFGPVAAIGKGVAGAWSTTTMTLQMLGRMVTGQVSVKNIGGPIAIADFAGQTARAGLIRYLHFLAFISISIGIMNLLPIPVLDGGFLLYYVVEVVTGKTPSERFGEIMQRIGIVLLMLLLVVAVFNDITRLFS